MFAAPMMRWGQPRPMRAVQSTRYLYIFNPWSNGKRTLNSATAHMHTYHQMQTMAKHHPDIAERMDLLKYRVLEEFYDVDKDPDCLVNLIDKPELQSEIELHRTRLLTHMRDTQDHALPAFEQRDDPTVRDSYIEEQERQSKERKDFVRAVRDALRQEQLEDQLKGRGKISD